MRKSILAEDGAPPKGPYTPAVLASGPTLYISAQGPFDPETGDIVSDEFAEQARQVFDNVSALLRAAGATWQNVVKVQVFLADFADFAEMNEIYQQYVREPYPARTTVHSRIGASEIAVDAIAALDSEQ
jgi:2-iminobutanoate/2-iminopropanoate deaminase